MARNSLSHLIRELFILLIFRVKMIWVKSVRFSLFCSVLLSISTGAWSGEWHMMTRSLTTDCGSLFTTTSCPWARHHTSGRRVQQQEICWAASYQHGEQRRTNKSMHAEPSLYDWSALKPFSNPADLKQFFLGNDED